MKPQHRALLGWFLAGLATRIAWAATIPLPEDWDALYYVGIARHLAEGDGAVSRALGSLHWLPERLPLPADPYWMPLPSRVLVPGLWMWPEHGEFLAPVLFGALWAPCAWGLTRRLTDDPRAPHLAAMLALFGGLFARLASSPDVYALFGLIGALMCFAVDRGRWRAAAGLAVLAALTRNDGFWLGLAAAVGFRGLPALAVASAGAVTAGLWSVRCWLLLGDTYLRSRWITSNAAEYPQLFDGREPAPLRLLDRIGLALEGSGTIGLYLVSIGLIVLVPATLFGAWSIRSRPITRFFFAYLLLAPLLTDLLAPMVIGHGTLYRTGVAIFVAHMSLAAIGVFRLSDRLVEQRDYPPWLLPTLHVGAFALVSLAMGHRQYAGSRPSFDCGPLEAIPDEQPVFTADALLVESVCDQAAVMLTFTTPPEVAAEVAARLGVCTLLPTEGHVLPHDVPAILPGWSPDGALWHSPTCPPLRP